MASKFEINVLNVAVKDTVADPTASTFYNDFLNNFSFHETDKIKLTCTQQHSSGDQIESAIRKVVGDSRKNRDPDKKRIDVIYKKTIIEVKYGRAGFKGLATDSQGLRSRTDKWYLYVAGDVCQNELSEYTVWFMRADKLFDALVTRKAAKAKTTVQQFLAGSISADLDDRVQSLKDINAQIDIIQNDLARAIFDKASGDDSDKTKKIMGIDKKIGINRVRFDLKFEQLIHSYVHEIIRG
jgi:hypothetical protein